LKEIEDQNEEIQKNPQLKKLKDNLDQAMDDYEKTKNDPLLVDRNLSAPLHSKKLQDFNPTPISLNSPLKANFIEPNVANKKFVVLSDYKLALANERHIKNMEKLKLILENNSNNNDSKELKQAIDDGKKLLAVNLNLLHQEKINSLNLGKQIEKKHLEIP
jgi:hypothetical protein